MLREEVTVEKKRPRWCGRVDGAQLEQRILGGGPGWLDRRRKSRELKLDAENRELEDAPGGGGQLRVWGTVPECIPRSRMSR